MTFEHHVEMLHRMYLHFWPCRETAQYPAPCASARADGGSEGDISTDADRLRGTAVYFIDPWSRKV